MPQKQSPTAKKCFPPQKGPLFGVLWWLATVLIFSYIAGTGGVRALQLVVGVRSLLALTGYVVMQIGLWKAEFKWDEEGSQAYLAAASRGTDVYKDKTPEELQKMVKISNVSIPEAKLKAAFPTPWGFLIGWWLWGLSYLFPISGSATIAPTFYGKIAPIVCFAISFVASVPMSDAVMYRKDNKKKLLSLMFLAGWITLGVCSALDVIEQLPKNVSTPESASSLAWFLCMAGPLTVIVSQKILFGARKMGTFWETQGKPNFNPIVYNMGGPLFVWAWFLFWMGTCALPVSQLGSGGGLWGSSGSTDHALAYATPGGGFYESALATIPLFTNCRTLVAFVSGCGMVPIVRFLDYAHDLDGPWMNERTYKRTGKVFSRWWLGTDGTYFGLFLESPVPFVIMWTLFGLSSWFTSPYSNAVDPGTREFIIFANCLTQGVDAGILIQQNLYAGNMAGKQKFSVPFVLLFVALAVNIGSSWGWRALKFSIPGAVLIVLGQKTVFGARRRGDYTMQHNGKANPYASVYVYTWGEVFFMMGWILICWGASMP